MSARATGGRAYIDRRVSWAGREHPKLEQETASESC
jgi:hypothetical protein